MEKLMESDQVPTLRDSVTRNMCDLAPAFTYVIIIKLTGAKGFKIFLCLPCNGTTFKVPSQEVKTEIKIEHQQGALEVPDKPPECQVHVLSTA
jgi:hypothetical protein